MTHRADAAPAVDQGHLVARQLAPKAGGGVMIGGVALTARRAIDTDSLDSHRAIVSDRFAPIQTPRLVFAGAVLPRRHHRVRGDRLASSFLCALDSSNRQVFSVQQPKLREN